MHDGDTHPLPVVLLHEGDPSGLSQVHDPRRRQPNATLRLLQEHAFDVIVERTIEQEVEVEGGS
jgi:hypothetical protein